MKFEYTPVSNLGVELKTNVLVTDTFKSIDDIFKTVISGVSWFKPLTDKKHSTAIATVIGFDYLKIEALRRSPELHAAAAAYDGGKWVSKLTLKSTGRTERASSATNVKLSVEITDNLEFDTEREISKPAIVANDDNTVLTVSYKIPVRELTVVETTTRAKKSDMESFIQNDPAMAAAFKLHLETAANDEVNA